MCPGIPRICTLFQDGANSRPSYVLKPMMDAFEVIFLVYFHLKLIGFKKKESLFPSLKLYLT